MNHNLEAGAALADEERQAAVAGAAPNFLSGGGESGALIRALDWAVTPLGPPEAWPQPLKTVTAIMLGSAQPMLVVWGSARITLYNDGYAAMCGDRHPRALGRPYAELWFDIWDEVEPILARAYAGESTHMDDIQFTMHRHGYPEETHFAFSYTPVRGEDGAVAGMFCACTETTQTVLAERRRLADIERERRMFQRAPGFITILGGPDHVFEFANDAYVRLVGGRELVGRSAREALPEVEGQGFFELLDRVYTSGERFVAEQVPISLRSAAGAIEEHFLDFIYEPIFDEAGAVTGIFVEGHDVTESRRIAVRLRDQAEELQAVLDAVPAAIWIARDPGSREISGNRTANELLRLEAGRNNSTSAEGTDRPTGFTVHHQGRELAPHEMPVQRAASGEAIEHFEEEVRFDDGTRVDLYGNATPLRDAEGAVRGAVAAFVDVTDLKRAEAARIESEARYRTLFNSIDAGFCIIELIFDEQDRPLDYRFIEVNPAFERQTGLSDAAGRTMLELAPAHERSWFEIYGRVALTGEPARFENKSEVLGRWFDLHAFRVDDPAARRVAVLFEDITGSKRAEAALRESEARFQAIANSIDQMIWSTRPDGYHDYYNRRWYEFTGMPEGSTDGDAWNGVFHPDDQEQAWSVWQLCLETGEPYHIEYRLRHRSGQYRWVLGRAQPVRDENGAISRWFGTCTDIQEIVEAREVLARSRQELEQLVEERTADRDRLWSNSLDLLLIARFDGTIVEVNPAWTTVLGWDEAELVGERFLDFIHPDDLPASGAEVAALTSEKRSTMQFENRYRAKDGRWVWLSWAVTSHAGLFHGVARDINDDKAQAEELERAQEQLRQSQKMEAIGQLTGGVAHDFNNLLTVIRGSADLLRRDELSDERRRKYVEAIADTADRAARLTGQLLAFARRQSLKPEVFNAADRVRAICEMIRTVVGARIEINLDLDDGCFVEADANQFETALLNLAVNARDAMDEEGKLSLSVFEAPGAAGQVAVRVADTGRGIPADRIGKIFEPFFTTKEVGKGTGLGLSQVYGFAKQSGGDVEVESEPGRGAIFTLLLPRADAPADTTDSGRAEGPASEHRGCVLVVEDNEQVGEFSSELLRELGYETIWAADAEAALTRLKERPGRYDLVFSDVVMPGMSGLELGAEIRRLYRDVPVVLTSGYSHVLAQDGAHGFELLRKPYSLEDLAATIAQAMARPAAQS